MRTLETDPIKHQIMDSTPTQEEQCWGEALIAVRDGSLYDIHQQVWYVINPDGGEQRSRDFQYAPLHSLGNGRHMILLRGHHLPQAIARRKDPPQRGTMHDFRILYRAIARDGKNKEFLVDQTWAAARLKKQFSQGGMLLMDGAVWSAERAFFGKRGHGSCQIPYFEVFGSVMVQDTNATARLMLTGIGSGKGLGFGMLVLV